MGRIAEERQRLSATWLNILAAGVITAGSVAPLASLAGAGWAQSASHLLAFCAGCVLLGIGLHLAARLLIRRCPAPDRAGRLTSDGPRAGTIVIAVGTCARSTICSNKGREPAALRLLTSFRSTCLILSDATSAAGQDSSNAAVSSCRGYVSGPRAMPAGQAQRDAALSTCLAVRHGQVAGASHLRDAGWFA